MYGGKYFAFEWHMLAFAMVFVSREVTFES